MSECKHTRVIQFFYTENLEPCGLWACAECNKKFAPIDRELALEKENAKLREVVESLLVGASAVAVPHPAERAVLQEAVNFARATIKETER